MVDKTDPIERIANALERIADSLESIDELGISGAITVTLDN